MEEEKVVKMDEHKSKSIRKKKILAAVASLMVVFVAANVYAGTMGYDNIFFMIKNMFEKTEVTNKDDILTDRDLTISYQSIETSDGLKIQVNRLVVKDNEAVLYMNIDKTNTNVNPARCIVHDITDGRNDLIGNESISNSKNEDRFEAQISLIGMKNNTNILKIELQDDNYNSIVELELDIANKTISIVGVTAKELEKISEVELKEVLGNYIRIFMFEDLGSVVKEVHTEQEYRNECIVDIALDYLTQEKNVYSADRSNVNSIIKEVTGEEITDVLPLSNLIIKYDKNTDSYNYFTKTKGRKALCLEVTDLKYSDGVYTATFTYCYPTEEDYKKGNVENLQLFSATMKLKINSDYEYAKYCMVDYENIERKKIDNNSQSIVNTNENTVTNIVNNNTVTNTLNNNTVTNTINNTTVTNTVTNNTSANTVANNHTHKYTVVESIGHTTIDGTHTMKCSICGDEKQEPHNFGKWWTINNGTAWTLWCKDCKTYVYTMDYNFVKKHSEYGMEPIEKSSETKILDDDINAFLTNEELIEKYNKGAENLDTEFFVKDFESYKSNNNSMNLTNEKISEIAEKGFEESAKRIASEGASNIETETIKLEEIIPNNYFTRKYSERDIKYYDLKMRAYVVTRTNEEGCGVKIYIDPTTALIVGGKAFGD